jgi:predicted dehydrogenase
MTGIRFGLVGTGYWARQTHAAALAAHPDADLVGVWGRSFARAGELAQAVGARPYERAQDMFADVDAVAFAVSPDVQADLAVQAAAQGCHLLMDKPVALTAADAGRVAEAVDRHGVRSLVFFTRRFTANQADWLSDVQREQGWNSGHVRMYASIFEPGNPYGESKWRQARGALWDIGPHALSILLPALGPVTHVIADHGLGDTVMIVLHHESGAASTMSLSLTAPPGSTGSTLEIFGQDRQTSLPEATSTAVQAMGVCISDLLGDQLGSWHHPCDANFGREVVKILQAADVFLRRPLDSRAQPVG